MLLRGYIPVASHKNNIVSLLLTSMLRYRNITYVGTVNRLSLWLVLVPELPVLMNGLRLIFTRFEIITGTMSK